MDGIDSALRAVTAMSDVVLHDVHYRCCLSRNLENKLNAMYAGYPTSPHASIYPVAPIQQQQQNLYGTMPPQYYGSSVPPMPLQQMAMYAAATAYPYPL